MKALLLLTCCTIFLLISCSEEVAINPVHDNNPEIDSLNQAFVGTWDLHDFTTRYSSRYVVLGNIPDFSSYSAVCDTVQNLTIQLKLPLSITLYNAI